MKEGYKYWIGVLAGLFLGMIFIVAGVGKLLVGSMSFMPVTSPSAITIISFAIFPYVEIIVGMCLILGVLIGYTSVAAALLISGFIGQNLINIYQGSGNLPCNDCFGIAGSLTAYSALFIDGLMVIMLILILICNRRSYFRISPWFLRKGEA